MRAKTKSKKTNTPRSPTSYLQVPKVDFAREEIDPDTIRFLFLTDNHLGYDERDPYISRVSYLI